MRFSLLCPLSALLLVFFGCQKVDDFNDAEIISGEAEFAIPLAHATTTIEDLLENFDDFTFIEITPDGVIHLRYRGDVLSQTANEFLLDAQNAIPLFIPILDTVFALPFSSPDQLEVDKAIYKTGVVSVAVRTSHVGPINLTVRLPQAKKNGVAMALHTQFTGPTEIPSPIPLLVDLWFSEEIGDTINMAGYELTPVDDSIYVTYEAYDEFGERLVFDSIFLVSQAVYFGYLEGYLGDFQHNGQHDTLEIDFFKNWIQGDVYFEDPKIFIHIENSFGVPTRSVIDTFDILTTDGQRIPLQSVFIDTAVNGINFPYPETPGQVARTTFTFDKSNSNITEVLSSRPIALDYDVDARMNPDNQPDIRGFITDSSYYNIQVEVDLPLHGRASGFGIRDSFDVDFSGYGDVKEAEFKLVADNGMPLEIEGQVYFLDANGAVLDSLFAGRTRLVAAAPVDSNGEVTEEVTQTTYATFPADRFANVRAAKRLFLQAFFSTSASGQISVRAYQGQAADIRMGMKLKTY